MYHSRYDPVVSRLVDILGRPAHLGGDNSAEIQGNTSDSVQIRYRYGINTVHLAGISNSFLLDMSCMKVFDMSFKLFDSYQM